jgi:hypothetical protein
MKAKLLNKNTVIDACQKVKPMIDDFLHGPDRCKSVTIPVNDGGSHKKVT